MVEAPDATLTTYTWDDENRTTKVEQPAGGITTAVYRHDGLRYEKQDSTGTSKTVWDGQNYLAETDESDVTQVVYTNKPEPYGKLISQRRKDA